MAQKKSTKTTKARSTSRATTAKSRTTTRKPTTKRTTTKKVVRKKTAPVSQKVDYYPNRVALLTATAAVLILLTLGLLTAM